MLLEGDQGVAATSNAADLRWGVRCGLMHTLAHLLLLSTPSYRAGPDFVLRALVVVAGTTTGSFICSRILTRVSPLRALLFFPGFVGLYLWIYLDPPNGAPYLWRIFYRYLLICAGIVALGMTLRTFNVQASSIAARVASMSGYILLGILGHACWEALWGDAHWFLSVIPEFKLWTPVRLLHTLCASIIGLAATPPSVLSRRTP